MHTSPAANMQVSTAVLFSSVGLAHCTIIMFLIFFCGASCFPYFCESQKKGIANNDFRERINKIHCHRGASIVTEEVFVLA